MRDDNRLLNEQLALARNFLRTRLDYESLGQLLDSATPAPTEIAGVGLLKDLVDRGVLLRELKPRQAFTLLVLKGSALWNAGSPA